MAFLLNCFLSPRSCSSTIEGGPACGRLVDKIIWIEATNVRNLDQKPVEMNAHRLSGAGAIAGFDCRCDRGVLLNRARHAAGLRQGQSPVAIDMNFDLFDERPNAATSGGLGDRAVKGLVSLMEGVAIADITRFALALQLGAQRNDVAALRALGGEPRGRLFQRLANNNRLRQRGERYACCECARLREYFDEPFVGELAHRLAHWRSAEAVGSRQIDLRNRLTRQAFERYEFGAQIRVDVGADPAKAGAARPRPARRRLFSRCECAQWTCLGLIATLPNWTKLIY